MSAGFKSELPGLDEYRWIRSRQQNIPLDQIAKEEGVSVEAVTRSIARIDRKRARLTLREIHAAEMSVLLSGVREEREAINSALTAVKRVQVLDVRGRPLIDKGEPIYTEVPDHETRMAAVQLRTAILNAIQPKGGGVNLNVSQVAVGGGGVSRRGVEARIIEFNKKRESLALLPAPAILGDDDKEDDE